MMMMMIEKRNLHTDPHTVPSYDNVLSIQCVGLSFTQSHIYRLTHPLYSTWNSEE